MNKLEKEFKKIVKTHAQEIDAKLTEASKALDEAIALSEKYGIPFYSRVSPLSQNFIPNSFETKFPDIDYSLAAEICNIYRNNDWYSGWEHSSIC